MIACEKHDEDEAAEHDGLLEVGRDLVQTVEVGVARVRCRNAVDGAARGNAILLHAGNDAVLRPGRAGEHEERDDDPERYGAEPEGAEEVADSKQKDDDGGGDESFMMQDVEAFGDDGAGGVRVGDGAERGPGGDGEEEEPAKPNDEGEPDDGAEQSLHARQGTALRVQGTGSRE